MSDRDTRNKIEDYLAKYKKMTLATVTTEGQPIAHTVQYVSEGSTVYFFTKPHQRKVDNIRNNSRTAFAVDRDYENWMEIQGVQMTGTASILQEEEEIRRVFGLFQLKFPPLAAKGKEFLDHHVIVRVDPGEGRFIDNTVSFGHYETVSY